MQVCPVEAGLFFDETLRIIRDIGDGLWIDDILADAMPHEASVIWLARCCYLAQIEKLAMAYGRTVHLT